MGLSFSKSGKYHTEKMETKDTKKHTNTNMLCFNNRSDSIVTTCANAENNNNSPQQQKKRFSLNRFKRRSKKSENDELEDLREEFDRVNRIRYDVESNRPIQLEESLSNCDGLVCLHNGSVVINKNSRRNSLEEEAKSKSVDCIHDREKDDDSLSFLSVKSEIITVSRKSSSEGVEVEIVQDKQIESCNQIASQEEHLEEKNENEPNSTDAGNEMDPTPPNSPQETILDTAYGTVLSEQKINELKTKIQKEIDRKTCTITEEDEENS